MSRGSEARRPVAAMILSLVLVSAATGCTRKASQPSSACPTLAAKKGVDTVFALISPRPELAELFAVTLSPLRFERLTKDSRVSSVDARGQLVVVADARLDVDRLEMWDGCRLTAIPQIGTPHAFTPAISPQGVIAYVELIQGAGALEFQLKTWDPARRVGRTLLTSTRPVSDPCWSSRGTLFVLRDGGDRAVILEVGLGGGVSREIDPGLPRALIFACRPGSPLAIGPGIEEPQRTLLLNPDGTRGAIVEGWRALGWSPDGTRLLMTREDGQLGIASAPTYDPVVIGRSPHGNVWQVGWAD